MNRKQQAFHEIKLNGRCASVRPRILHGDCLKALARLDDQSVQTVITSPPYAEQRKHHYQGVPEQEYPTWMVAVFEAIRPKLTVNGSILVNIRSHVKAGAVSDYVLQTRLALRKAGWLESEELIWLKPDAAPHGSKLRPRRTWENVLWFSQCKQPFSNLNAMGRWSKGKGFERTKKGNVHYKDLYAGENKRRPGLSRVADVIEVRLQEYSKGVEHSAPFPPALAEHLIQTFTNPGDTVLDPFAGSGTTLLVARALGRPSVGIELDKKNIEIIRQRLREINWNRIPRFFTMPENVALVNYISRISGVHIDPSVLNLIRDDGRWRFLDMR